MALAAKIAINRGPPAKNGNESGPNQRLGICKKGTGFCRRRPCFCHTAKNACARPPLPLNPCPRATAGKSLCRQVRATPYQAKSSANRVISSSAIASGCHDHKQRQG